MSKIVFSIIVPVYNVERYLDECIQSVLNQTYSNFQLILVDDGSLDNSSLICDQYQDKDKRITVIHKKNGGVVSARQAGVKIAIGEYIVFLDGDDYLELEYLSNFKDVINDYFPDIICCNAFYLYKNKKKKVKLQRFDKIYDREKIENELFPRLIQTKKATQVSGFPVSLWAKAFKNDLYQQQQLVNASLNIGEDGACVIPCVFHSDKIIFIRDHLYNYRQNLNSATKSRKVLSFDFPRIVSKHIREKIDIKQFDFEEQLNRKIVHDLFSVVVSQFYKKETYKNIIRMVKKELNDEEFDTAIKKARFIKFSKAFFMHLSLKFNWFPLIYLYSRIK